MIWIGSVVPWRSTVRVTGVPRWPADQSDRVVEGLAGERLAVDLEDDVAGAEAGRLGRRALDRRHDGQPVLLHVDLDADAVERASEIGVAELALGWRLIDGVRVADRVDHAL